MPFNPRNIPLGKYGFTLIELIIVVIIVAILAVVALPRYYANIAKATKARVQTNLKTIRDVAFDFYAVYGTWPTSGSYWNPITVTVDGEAVSQVSDPTDSSWRYEFNCATNYIAAHKNPGDVCTYTIICSTGVFGGSCTP